MGRLVDDCVYKTLPTGTPLVEFSIANNRGWGDNAKVHYFNVKMFGKGADAINQYLTKGTQVAISGELTQERWQDNNGKNQYKIVIVTFDVQLLGSPKNNNNVMQETVGGLGDDADFNAKYCKQSKDMVF